MRTTLTTLDPHRIRPPHGVHDRAKYDRLVTSMAEGWQGRALLAWRCGGEGTVFGLTGSHRTAAARAAVEEVPVLVLEIEDGDEALASDLESLRDFGDLLPLLRAHGVDEDAIELAQAEVDQDRSSLHEIRISLPDAPDTLLRVVAAGDGYVVQTCDTDPDLGPEPTVVETHGPLATEALAVARAEALHAEILSALAE